MEVLAVYGGLFASAFLAATILPASSEPLLAALATAGSGHPALLFLIATIGNTAGSVLNYFIGRGIDAVQGRTLMPPPKQLERAARVFRRFGIWTLPFAWLPVIGDALTIAAGVARIRLWLFVVLVAIGKAGRYAAILAALWIT